MVSNDEMRRMRDNGMTNRDIANSLDISYVTVLKHIGPQPGRNWEDYKRRMDEQLPGQMNINDYEDDEHEACLMTSNIVKYLEGDVAEWCVDGKNKTIMMKIETGCIMLPFDKIEDFIKEAEAIKRHMNDVNVPVEMW